MELHLKLNKISKNDIDQEIFENNLFLALRLKNEILNKRRKFASSLKKIKDIHIKKSKKDAYKEAKAEILSEFFKANDFYHQSVLNANKDCLDVSLKIAKEIIEKELSDDLSILVNKINASLKALNDAENYKVKCNTSIAKKMMKENIGVHTIIDDSLKDSEAILISSAGSIQIDIEDEFNFLKSKLKEELRTICL
ncbi:MAG: FliH/SctL family protein [Bdellovibrionota bacterium]